MRSGSATWIGAAWCLLACGCTALAGLDKPYHPIDGEAGGGGAGGADGGSGGGGGEIGGYQRCSDVPESLPDGAYALDPDGSGPEEELLVYCGPPIDGERWALVYNSVGSEEGTTLAFWKFLYSDRLKTRGEPSIENNHYQPALYRVGREYRDEIEDREGLALDVMRATAEGIDTETMRFVNPVPVSGHGKIFEWQFAAGWSSTDYDGDTDDDNCAEHYAGVAQHYGYCFVYNLGADADDPYEDGGFGPHIATDDATAFGFVNDGTPYTRLNRISRWTRW
ncbi:fibrinogen-like YCDxxxxGGGW domain-containing protein [Sorangium sp. So ce131]|uniref:fibrinogen-like YCDxxxxGGGW domain-containing protein n=1 Tax=Sorangium sp. So ce131 TaxID=3133282 RepID=UPI003F6124C6